MQVEFHRLAAREVREAWEWYEAAQTGLGGQLRTEIRDALLQISAFPAAWPEQTQRTRRIRLTRFPYGIVYQVRKDTVFVVAFMHLHRKPDYWISRINKAR